MSNFTKKLSFSAMAIALAMVASMLKLWNMPMGGSITLFSMLFVTLIGNWYGLGMGICTAVAYGLLQFAIDPFMVSIPQVVLDYFFAFGALGLSGLFKNQKNGLVIGYVVAVFGRFVFSTISGYIFFPTFMPEFFESPLIYSICYNGAYIGAEAVLTVIVVLLKPVKKALGRVKQLAI